MAKRAPVPGAEVKGEARLDLAPLSKWINALLSTNLILRQGCADLQVAKLCEALGILQKHGLAETVVCRECEEPHAATVLFDNGRVYYHCIFNGDVELAEEEVELLSFNRDKLLDEFAAAAGLAPRGRASYAGGRLVKLGLVEDEERVWVLAYADGLDDPNSLDGVIESIEQLLPHGPGLVATPSRIPLTLPLPRSYKVIAAHELFFGAADRIVLDWPMALSRLARRKKLSGAPGRPTEREKTRGLRAELIEAGRWPAMRVAQVALILQGWPEDDPQRPAGKTIENHLRQIEEEERDLRPS